MTLPPRCSPPPRTGGNTDLGTDHATLQCPRGWLLQLPAEPLHPADRGAVWQDLVR